MIVCGFLVLYFGLGFFFVGFFSHKWSECLSPFVAMFNLSI